MKTFLWVSFVLHIFAVFNYCYQIHAGKYPRIAEKKPTGDMVSAIFAMGYAMWAGVLIFS